MGEKQEYAPFRVGAARCDSYEPSAVEEAVERAVQASGGWPESCCSEEVLLKANLLAPRPPEDAVTTHPEVLRGVVRSLRRRGAGRIRIGDNPGYIYASQKELLLERTGMKRLGEDEDVPVGTLSDEGVEEVPIPGGRVLSRARVSTRILRSRYLVNVAKLKTHVETEMTGCLKNLFGIADTQTRKRAHQSRDTSHLVHGILDLFTLARPLFHVLDAVVAMEGNGPSHGSPKRVGWILAGPNAPSIDLVAAVSMGYSNPFDIPLLRTAAERGLGPRSLDEVDLRGANWEELPTAGFRRASGLVRFIPTPLRGFAHRWVALRPQLERSACVRCRVCQEVCPVDAISWDDGPVVDSNRCVQCLCCHEMCPTGAMKAAANPLARWVQGMRS